MKKRRVTVSVLAVAIAVVAAAPALPCAVAGCGSSQPATTTVPQLTTSTGAQAPTTAPVATAPSTTAPMTGAAPTTAASTTVAPTTTMATPKSVPVVSTTSPAQPDIVPGVPSVVYEDPRYGFSLEWPQSATAEATGFEQFLPLTQSLVVAAVLPEELFVGTNLREAGVYLGASSSSQAVNGWDQPAPGSGEVSVGTAEIGGLSFAVFTLSEGAAGNIYEERVYRTLHAGTCFEIVELLHSTEIGNYTPGTVVEFDRAEFQGYLEAIAESFRFIES